jgi:hypothetical protein
MTILSPVSRRPRRWAVGAAGLVAAVGGLVGTPQASAVATVPPVAAIVEGVGAASVDLGMTKTQVTARWGTPSRCRTTTSSEVCTFSSVDGIQRAMVVLNGSPRRVGLISVGFDNQSWTTTRGIHIGSTASPSTSGTPAGDFDRAYGGLVDPSRSTYYSRAVPGTDALGRPSLTRFTLGWFAEYTPGQYFGVTGITITAG